MAAWGVVGNWWQGSTGQLVDGQRGRVRTVLPPATTFKSRQACCATSVVNKGQPTKDSKHMPSSPHTDVVMQRPSRKAYVPRDRLARNVVSIPLKLSKIGPRRRRPSIEAPPQQASIPTAVQPVENQEQFDTPLLTPNKAFPFLLEPPQRTMDGMHKPLGLVLASAYILATACRLSGAPESTGPLAVAWGGALGTLFAALNRYGMKRFWKAPRAPLNVVITGGGKGIGKAIAREFLRLGDRVMLTSRSTFGVKRALMDLRSEVGAGAWVAGIDCDVTSPAAVERLRDAAASQLGRVDIWINNAGCSGGFKDFLEATTEDVATVVNTNLLGCLLSTRAALRLLVAQPKGGHVFNMDGAGADGLPTPQYAAYGASKAGIAHLMGSLAAELGTAGVPVGVHTLSPGMVLTDLLLAGATPANKQIFNILCEQPETVAAFLVPRMRTVAARGGAGRYIRYLTLVRAAARFLSAPVAKHRFFDAEGNPQYKPERERICGQRNQQVQRAQRKAAQRSGPLAAAYATSMATSCLLLLSNAMAAAPH